MINRKKVFLLLVILMEAWLFTPEASAQRKRRPRQSFSTAGVSLTSASTQKLNATANDVGKSFAEALTVIQKNYVDGKKLSYNDVVKSSIVGMLHTLDPHSNYYDANGYAALKVENGFGIGVTLGDRRLGGESATFVLASSENSPAANANLRFGDRIIDVNGWEAKGHSSTEVSDRLRGARGSQVKITIERGADDRRQTVELTRSGVQRPSLPDAYLLQAGVGYIDFTPGFSYTAADELADKLGKLRKQGMTALVLDLRDNPGGFLDEAIRIAEQFLPSDQIILKTAGRSRRSYRLFKSQNRDPDKSALVLLVNRKTASGSEIIAAALQDHDRALIVGEMTFGQGVIQSIIPLDYGAGLNLTTSKIHTPLDRLIQRDYSNLGFYEYNARGNAADNAATSETGTNRREYRGAGIVPDEVVRPLLPTRLQERIVDPVFGFVRELVNARIVGFESYKAPGPIDFTQGVKPDDLAVTDDLFKAFKEFVASMPGYKLTDRQLDANREFIVRQVRYDIATAAYGPLMAARLLRVEDPQVLKAIEVVPKATALVAEPRKMIKN